MEKIRGEVLAIAFGVLIDTEGALSLVLGHPQGRGITALGVALIIVASVIAGVGIGRLSHGSKAQRDHIR